MTRSPSISSAILLTVFLIHLNACQVDEKTVNAGKDNILNHSHNQHNHNQHKQHNQHKHSNLEVSDFEKSTPIPRISFIIEPDSMSGWNIHISTEHFRFAPENVNTHVKTNEGHAHLYINNHKMARLYGNWYHLKNLMPGKHEVRITLNANDHSNWSHQGQVIAATQTITQH